MVLTRRRDGQTLLFSHLCFSTPGSALARQLQQQEALNNQGRAHKFRIVEKTGVSVRNMLSRNYPWGVRKCKEEKCFQCSSCPDPKYSCRKPGIAYTITCLKCVTEGLKSVYEGESSKNAYARGKKHLQELKSSVRTSGMVIHDMTPLLRPTFKCGLGC